MAKNEEIHFDHKPAFWLENFIICPDSLGAQVFKIFVVICSLVSSIIYTFFAAFRYDKEGNNDYS